MKYILNILVLGLIGLLGYMLVNSIKEPIAFQDVKTERTIVVAEKLDEIRTAQQIYKSITGSYAESFEKLTSTLTNDSIPFVKVIGDPDDPENKDKFTTITTYSSAKDSIDALGIDLSTIAEVPYSNGVKFSIQADTIEYQSTEVNVVEVGTKWKEFMGKYGDPSYKKYDKSYEPNKMIKFGDMNGPSLSGNWE